MRRHESQLKPTARLRPSGWDISTAALPCPIAFTGRGRPEKNAGGMFTDGGALM